MLRGVLLHVIEAAGPVDLTGYAVVLEGLGEYVLDGGFAVDDVDYRDALERAEIVGLAAGGGIEGSAVQNDAQAVFAKREDLRVKVA